MNEREYYLDFEDDVINNTYQSIYQDYQNSYGINCMYLPIDDYVNNVDGIWGELEEANYTSMYGMRMILEDASMLQGPGDMFSKFGLQIQDEIVLYSTRKEFMERITDEEIDPHDGSNVNLEEKEQENIDDGLYRPPTIRDLVYVPMWKKMFEITYVEYFDYKFGSKDGWYKLLLKIHKIGIGVDNIDVDETGNDVSMVDAISTNDYATEISAIEDDVIENIQESTNADVTETGYEPNDVDGIINDNAEIERDDIKPVDETNDFLSDW